MHGQLGQSPGSEIQNVLGCIDTSIHPAHGISGRAEYVIPSNWKEYVSKDMLDKYYVKSLDGFLVSHFQGDVTGIDIDNLL